MFVMLGMLSLPAFAENILLSRKKAPILPSPIFVSWFV